MEMRRSQLGNKYGRRGFHPCAALSRSAGRLSGWSHPTLLLKGLTTLQGLASSRRLLISAAAVAASAIGFGGIASRAMASGLTLTGAGSTLVAHFEAEWAQGFDSKYGDTVSYSAVGSGTGITDISQRIVGFGASDAPLTPTQASACNGCTEIPWALTATGVGYNVPGIGSKLHLTGADLAGIYLGQITNWDSSVIKQSNPHVKLPNLAITPIYRSDGSGDTYAFTNYLSHVSTTWSKSVSYATSVDFPHGISAKGNSGVAALLQSTQGGIAYVAVSYLIADNIDAAAVQNAAGNYEYPNLANISNAAAQIKRYTAGNPLSIVDPSKKAKIAYPISTFTYAIVPKSGNSDAQILKAFIGYAITTGQRSGPSLDFAPLPKAVLAADKSAVAGLS
jgi:phosphate transport system substrate-binding protein